MTRQIHVVDDAEEMASLASLLVARRAATAVADHGSFRFAVSGGHTPWTTFERLAERTMFPWGDTVVYQVDERIAPPEDRDRNLHHLAEVFPPVGRIEPMPVDEDDLEGACRRYEERLPAQFDLIHLGLGSDGHTASLVPGDGVLQVEDRLVALTDGPYEGRRRMTLTYPGLARAREAIWLVAGADKRSAMARLIAGDHTIPAGLVPIEDSIVIVDKAAAPPM